jgi:photosystem II stability/assembly factor-like uncharacterized protein
LGNFSEGTWKMKKARGIIWLLLVIWSVGCKDLGSIVPSRQSVEPPSPVPFWKHSGLSGELVVALAANADSMVIAAVSGSSGTRNLVFQTTNNGELWSELHLDQASLLLSVDKKNTFYAVSSNFYATDLHRSTDNGATWIRLSIPRTNISSICFDTANSVFLGDGGGDHSPGGVLRSTDGGTSWLYADSLTGTGIVCMTAHSGNVFAATRRGIFRTEDGIRWQLVNSQMKDAIGLSFLAMPSGDLLLGVINRGLMRSTDHGVTWSSTALSELAILSASSNSRGTIIAAHTELRGIGLERIQISSNSGQTWKSDTAGLHEPVWSRTLAVTSNGYVFVGTNSGVYRNATALR